MKSEPKSFVPSSANSEVKVASGKRQEKAVSQRHLPAPGGVLYSLLCRPHEPLAIKCHRITCSLSGPLKHGT